MSQSYYRNLFESCSIPELCIVQFENRIKSKADDYNFFCKLWEQIAILMYLHHIPSDPAAVDKLFTAFLYLVPNSYVYKLTLFTYQCAVYSEKVFEIIKSLPYYGHPTFPQALKDMDVLTVYRGGYEPIEEAAEHFSWTIHSGVAVEYIHRGKGAPDRKRNLYQGKIKKSDVFAYCGFPKAYEIIQDGAVYDIVDITESALNTYRKNNDLRMPEYDVEGYFDTYKIT